jgi:ribosomal-protein-alanine N-acetyltransferase
MTGYAIYSVIADTAELLRIAVDPEHRGQGIASSIMEEMLGKLDDSSADRIMLEVRSKNEGAIALYEKFGFKNIAARKDYYSNPVDDALIYELMMN